MAIIEIPPVEFNPELVSSYEPLTKETGEPYFPTASALPSPRPIDGIATIANQAAFSAAIDLVPIRAKVNPARSHPNLHTGNLLIFPLPIEDGQVQYEIDDELAQFTEAIGLMAGHEHIHYPDRRYQEARVLIDQTPVVPGKAQRGAVEGRLHLLNHHRDPADSIYGVSDNRSTIHMVTDNPVCPADFSREPGASLPEGVTEFQADPYVVTHSNFMSDHYSPLFEEAADRTFFRLSYIYER